MADDKDRVGAASAAATGHGTDANVVAVTAPLVFAGSASAPPPPRARSMCPRDERCWANWVGELQRRRRGHVGQTRASARTTGPSVAVRWPPRIATVASASAGSARVVSAQPRPAAAASGGRTTSVAAATWKPDVRRIASRSAALIDAGTPPTKTRRDGDGLRGASASPCAGLSAGLGTPAASAPVTATPHPATSFFFFFPPPQVPHELPHHEELVPGPIGRHKGLSCLLVRARQLIEVVPGVGPYLAPAVGGKVRGLVHAADHKQLYRLAAVVPDKAVGGHDAIGDVEANLLPHLARGGGLVRLAVALFSPGEHPPVGSPQAPHQERLVH